MDHSIMSYKDIYIFLKLWWQQKFNTHLSWRACVGNHHTTSETEQWASAQVIPPALHLRVPSRCPTFSPYRTAAMSQSHRSCQTSQLSQLFVFAYENGQPFLGCFLILYSSVPDYKEKRHNSQNKVSLPFPLGYVNNTF